MMFLPFSVKDGLSLSLGVISAISWTIAQLPQIITNYNEKSTKGLSIAFLVTWLLGDILNLLGCLMEPATIPTQLYIALVYTVGTAILYVQSIYYGHIYPCLKSKRNQKPRSEETKLGEGSTSPSKKSMLCIVSAFFFLGTFNFANLVGESRTTTQNRVFVVGAARKLLHVTSGSLSDNNEKIGMLFGWAMTAIYMGGRLPQIYLNTRRGHVEGLNPLMFFFALVGNITYVASILVNSIEWFKIAPNLPWLVDAGGCIVLDFLILLQFLHYQEKVSYKKVPETSKEAS